MELNVYSWGKAGDLYQLMCVDCGCSFASKYADEERCPSHRRKLRSARTSRDTVVRCPDCGTEFTTRYPETLRCGPCALTSLVKGS